MNYDDRDSTFGKPEYYGMFIDNAKSLALRNGYNLIREITFDEILMEWPNPDQNYVCSRITFLTSYGRVLRAVIC